MVFGEDPLPMKRSFFTDSLNTSDPPVWWGNRGPREAKQGVQATQLGCGQAGMWMCTHLGCRAPPATAPEAVGASGPRPAGWSPGTSYLLRVGHSLGFLVFLGGVLGGAGGVKNCFACSGPIK